MYQRLTLFTYITVSVLFFSACADVTTNPVKVANKTNTTNTWQTVNTNNHFSPRHEAGLIAIDNQLYLLGGRRIQAVNVLNIDSNHWQNKTPPPIEIHHFQPVVFNNNIYIIGAMTGKFPHETPLSHILIYKPTTDTWLQGDEIPIDRRRGSVGVSIYNNKIYVSGGITDGHYDGTVAWFDEYDPKTGKWRKLADMPHKRDHFQAAVINHNYYIAGGRTTSAKTKNIFNLLVRDVDVYNFHNNTWSTLSEPLPTGRAGNTTIAVNNQLWVLGGESANQKNAHNEVEIFNVTSQTWRKGMPLNQGRHGTGAAIINEQLWTGAGCGNRGGKPELSTIEKLSL